MGLMQQSSPQQMADCITQERFHLFPTTQHALEVISCPFKV